MRHSHKQIKSNWRVAKWIKFWDSIQLLIICRSLNFFFHAAAGYTPSVICKRLLNIGKLQKLALAVENVLKSQLKIWVLISVCTFH